MASPKPSIGMLKRLLGTELLRLREAAGLRQQDAAAHLGKAANKISRTETGQIGIEAADLEKLLELYDAPEKDKVWCRHLASGSRVRRGRPTGETTLYLGPKWFRAFRDLEAGATEIMDVSSEIVPGILQTDAYTSAMFVAQGVHPDDQQIEDTILVRADRRELLTRDNPPKYSFVLSESALRRQFGGPTVMAEQLRHLADMALLPNVELQVVPFNTQSYQPLSCKFTLFRFGRDMGDDIIYIELLYADAVYLDKPPETVARYSELFGRLHAIALGPVESRNFILGLVDQFAANPNTRG
jgi:transcriptional regulator with XRE-family HTH domain